MHWEQPRGAVEKWPGEGAPRANEADAGPELAEPVPKYHEWTDLVPAVAPVATEPTVVALGGPAGELG